MNFKKKRAGLALLATAAVALAIWLIATRQPAQGTPLKTTQSAVPPTRNGPDRLHYPEGAPQLTMIQSREMSSSALPVTDSLNARVAYDEDVTARISVSFSGRIVALKAAPGARVKAGQALAEIDSADIGTANADLVKARADEVRKRLVMLRSKELVQGEAIAVKDWEAAEADHAQAQAETARAELRLKNLNPHGLAVRGQRVSLASPVDGVVAERNATPALEVSPSLTAPLFVVTDPRHLWLMIDLPEKLLGKVKLASAVRVESDAFPDEHFEGRIVQLGQVVDPNTRRVVVRARLDNPAGKLLPEMFVRASLLQDSGTGVQVPNSAIVTRGVYAFVFVETGPGAFERRQVQMLTRGSESSFVGEGLRGGERVVVTGALLLDPELSAGK